MDGATDIPFSIVLLVHGHITDNIMYKLQCTCTINHDKFVLIIRTISAHVYVRLTCSWGGGGGGGNNPLHAATYMHLPGIITFLSL